MEHAGGIRRGDVHLVELAVAGGVLRKRRPALVIQNDLANRHAADTIVVAIRDVHGGRLLPVHVAVRRGTGGLEKDSVIDAGHVMTVPQAVLSQSLGRLPPEVMRQVDRAILISLGLAS
ncbi:MAG TPA: type II toxin-antitoxin system PemK/MazF family toxin [Planctomycetota bacterium]|nr:type II toxin-antitoxin system PemK/MazF family toxin [Planctomycetota bacterium]